MVRCSTRSTSPSASESRPLAIPVADAQTRPMRKLLGTDLLAAAFDAAFPSAVTPLLLATHAAGVDVQMTWNAGTTVDRALRWNVARTMG
jgi:hypothetical protein